MDPNVQVALVSVLATTVTTLGVVMVAVINNRRERAGAASAGVEAGLDERDVLDRMLSLIAENDRKEETITALRKKNREATAEKHALEKEIRMLKAENVQLILKVRSTGDAG